MEKRVNTKLLVICVILAFLPGAIGSMFTSPGANSEWYEINKPSYTPPDFVFPIAWTILYLLIGIALYLTWSKARKKEKKSIAWIYGINLFLNMTWSIFFFGMQKPTIALINLALIIITIIGMIIVSGKIDRRTRWILLPYLVWCGFAFTLNIALV